MEKTIKTGKLGTLGEESRFTYGGVEWVALDARPNMTLCIAADVLECRAFDDGNKNDFAASSLRAYLNGEFLDRLAAEGADKEAFVPLVLDLTSDDGLDDYGTDTVKIGLISCEMYRRFRKLIPNVSDWWWTCAPFSTEKNGYGSYVRSVNTSGALSRNIAYDGYFGVRPLCALKSDILVSFDEERIKERTPSIGEMIARGLAEGLRDMFSGGNEESKENAPTEQAAEEQPDEEANKRAEAVDMMKHIAAAFDIPATIDGNKTAAELGKRIEGVSLGGCRLGVFECIRAAQEQFISQAARGGRVHNDGLSAIVYAYETMNAIDDRTWRMLKARENEDDGKDVKENDGI